MPDDPYTLSDLARLADVTPRTIRYYVAQGLLPSPEAAGPNTRYGEGHLLRLRLIRRLQREHLPLAEIRARLERMDDDEVRVTLDATGDQASSTPEETLSFVRSLMTQSGIAPRTPPPGQVSQPVARMLLASAAPMADEEPAPAAMPPSAPASSSGPVPPPRSTPDRSTWERLAITQDVELHVRRPLDRQSNRKVEQLVRIARELFTEEP